MNKKFGRLTVIKYENWKWQNEEEADHRSGKIIYLTCKCDCGNIVNHVSHRNLQSGHTQSCGCLMHEQRQLLNKTEKHNVDDIIGTKVGALLVEEYLYNERPNNDKNKQLRYFYKCKCDCGNEIIVERSKLLSASTRSCGCKLKYLYFNNDHFYNIYNSMKKRCYDEKCDHYHRYGGRGIKVCDRWLESFENFKEDMYDSYIKHCEEFGQYDTTIDRINNDNNYCPENCRWATRIEQYNNKSTNHMISIFGDKPMSIADACRYYGTNGKTYKQVYEAIKRNIDPRVALFAPSGKFKEFENSIYNPIEFFDPDNPPDYKK